MCQKNQMLRIGKGRKIAAGLCVQTAEMADCRCVPVVWRASIVEEDLPRRARAKTLRSGSKEMRKRTDGSSAVNWFTRFLQHQLLERSPRNRIYCVRRRIPIYLWNLASISTRELRAIAIVRRYSARFPWKSSRAMHWYERPIWKHFKK